MSNFGFTDLRLVNPYDVAFQEARSAVRSKYILDQARVSSTIEEAVAGCSLVVGTTALGNRDLHTPLHRLESAARLLRGRMKTSQAALLFGSEKFGLSNDDMARCHWLLRIPTRTEHGSMNLGQAVAICLYELRRDAAVARQKFDPPQPLLADNEDRLTELLLDVLGRSNYIHQRSAKSTELKIRRLVKRARLPENDAEVWLGMFRQILWKLSRPEQNTDAMLKPDDEGANHV